MGESPEKLTRCAIVYVEVGNEVRRFQCLAASVADVESEGLGRVERCLHFVGNAIPEGKPEIPLSVVLRKAAIPLRFVTGIVPGPKITKYEHRPEVPTETIGFGSDLQSPDPNMTDEEISRALDALR